MFKKLALIVGILAVLGSAGYLWLVHSVHKTFESAAPQMSDIAVAIKGSLGEVIFNPKPGEAKTIITDKTGLEALLQRTNEPAEGRGVLETFKRDPDKFRRYAEMVDTATRAKQLAAFLETRTFVNPVESTAISNLPADLTRDSWNNPYCIFQISNGLAVVSGVVRGKAGTCKLSSKRTTEFAQVKRAVYQSEAGEVVVISRKEKKPS